jgi:branched-chain amino acid transport system substrate-binding protein
LRSRRTVASGGLAVALAVGVAACGGGGGGGGGGSSSGSSGGKTLDVYSSLPLQGASRAQTAALVNGMRLSLKQHNNKAGNFTIKYTSLDDSTAQAGEWTPEQTTANARKVAQDQNAAAYLGEFNSGASAVSIPILNTAGVPQISPANTAVGLTTNDPGAAPGEPQKYYPTQKRTYARIVPKDTIQGAALVTLMKQDGCKKVELTNDKEVYGAGLAKNIQLAAKSQGLTIASNDPIDKNAANYRPLALKAKSAGDDCFVFAGITANNAVQLFKDMAAALPSAKLYGPDGICEQGFTDPAKGGIPASIAPRFQCTVATLAPDQYPPSGKQFFTQYSQAYHDKHPDPYAIYGYEAMNLALDAIKRSGTGTRPDILKALYSTKDRQSVLGTYSIDQNGDTTLTDYGVYKIKGGFPSFSQTIHAKTGG